MNEFEKSVKTIRSEASKEYLTAIIGGLLASVGIYIYGKFAIKAGYHIGCADTLENVDKAINKYE